VDIILAVDAGTSGVRTVAYDNGVRIVDSSYRELTQYFPNPGEVEHDAAEITELAVSTLREVASRAQKMAITSSRSASRISAKQRSPSTKKTDNFCIAPLSGRTDGALPCATH
jgi:glycerol kinase